MFDIDDLKSFNKPGTPKPPKRHLNNFLIAVFFILILALVAEWLGYWPESWKVND
ncbi:MAG: hypothetical protein ABJN26_03770 [Stappiaceae bacterium]